LRLKRICYSLKGAFSLFFFISSLHSFGQEIFWKGKELQSSDHKTIDGEIVIRNADDTIKAERAVLYNKPKKVILTGNLSIVSKGTVVTGDSAFFFPTIKQIQIVRNAVINTADGAMRSNAFNYDMSSKILSSQSFTKGNSNGIQFKADRSIVFTDQKSIKLIGHAEWENDTIKGIADTIYLDKTNNLLKMSRKAKIIFKKREDEVAGRYIEIDMNTSKITKIEGSQVKRKDISLKAKRIVQNGEDYELTEDVEVRSSDSAVVSFGQKAYIQKAGMQMKINTKTRIRDKERKELFIYAPNLYSQKADSVEQYNFFKNTNLRGQFNGFGDSLSIIKRKDTKEIFLIKDAHIQNDSMYIEADTIEIFQDSLRQIIKAKRNALMIMITKPNRVNSITAAFIRLIKTDSISEMYANGDSESYLWNDEKSSLGINHTTSPSQTAIIKAKKISKVRTKGSTQSNFQPINKVDYGYINTLAVKLKETYSHDTLATGLQPVKNFLLGKKR